MIIFSDKALSQKIKSTKSRTNADFVEAFKEVRRTKILSFVLKSL